LNTSGLGSLNLLTDAGSIHIVAVTDISTYLTTRVYSPGATALDFCTYVKQVPAGNSVDIIERFDEFGVSGAGCDFANVGAFEFEFEQAANVDAALILIETAVVGEKCVPQVSPDNTFAASTGCVFYNSRCNDGDPCTLDSCNPTKDYDHACENAPICLPPGPAPSVGPTQSPSPAPSALPNPPPPNPSATVAHANQLPVGAGGAAGAVVVGAPTVAINGNTPYNFAIAGGGAVLVGGFALFGVVLGINRSRKDDNEPMSVLDDVGDVSTVQSTNPIFLEQNGVQTNVAVLPDDSF
jgi:hypothetical protein